MTQRTNVMITTHIDAIVAQLTSSLGALPTPVPVGFGERPIDEDKQHYPPPYIVISYLPGGLSDGPMSDSQADIQMRILITSMGQSAREATVLRDIANIDMMDKSNFSIAARKVRNLTTDGPIDGTYRDDDAPTPIFYTRQIYLLDTVPV